MDLILSWKDLNYFSSIMNTSFIDGSKFEDISKVGFIIILSFKC